MQGYLWGQRPIYYCCCFTKRPLFHFTCRTHWSSLLVSERKRLEKTQNFINSLIKEN